MARPGLADPGMVEHTKLNKLSVLFFLAWHGVAWPGTAGLVLAGCGLARCGAARLLLVGRIGQRVVFSWLGMAIRGLAR